MSKKVYNSPELSVYGTVSEMTQWYGGTNSEDVLYTAPDDDTVFAKGEGSINAVINPCITNPGDPLCDTNQP
jgi:hypothetical protein